MSLLIRHPRFLLLSCRSYAGARCMSTKLHNLPPVIQPSELQSLLSSNPTDTSLPRVIPMDASWFLPNDPQKRTGASQFASRRLSDESRFFDLDEVASHTSPYPHMLPTEKTFAEAMREMKIRKQDAVVVYESPDMGTFSGPRAAWTLRVFGHDAVSILDNFRTWLKNGNKVVESLPTAYTRDIKKSDEYPETQPDLSLVATFEEIFDIAKRRDKTVQILDARPNGRFTGKDPEPRPGISSGHIPGSLSVPFGNLLDPETKNFLPPNGLRKVFMEAGVDPDPKVRKISMCGTGVTAVVVDTALRIAGFDDTPESKRKVYDGSWTEWAQRVKESDEMIAKG